MPMSRVRLFTTNQSDAKSLGSVNEEEDLRAKTFVGTFMYMVRCCDILIVSIPFLMSFVLFVLIFVGTRDACFGWSVSCNLSA